MGSFAETYNDVKIELTEHCHELRKQKIHISPYRSAARNTFFVLRIVEFRVRSKRVQNAHLASSGRLQTLLNMNMTC